MARDLIRKQLFVFVLLTVFAVTVQAGVVAYWPFDTDPNNVQGNTAFDGIIVGDAVISGDETAVGAGALKIDTNASSPSTSVKIDPSPFVGVESEFSVSGWFQYSDISGDGSKDRVCVLETDDYWVTYAGHSGLNDANQVEMGEWYVDYNSDTSGPFVDPNTWHHFALVYNVAADYVLHFFDGELRDMQSVAGGDLDPTLWLNIGDFRDGNGGRNWDGYIDDIAIYDTALTIPQVEALAAKTSTPENVDLVQETAAWALSPVDGTMHVKPGRELSWMAPADIVNPTYNVLLSTSSDMSGAVTIASDISETTTTLPGPLTVGAVYYWRVDTVGGTASDIVSFTAYEELVAWWTFDTDFTDTIGSYDLTAQSGASIDAGGKIGGAASFDKSQSQYAKVDYELNALFAVDGDYTVSAWYKTNTADIPTGPDSAREFVFENQNYSASYGLRDLGSGDIGQMYTNTSTGVKSYNLTGVAAGAGVWHHIVITYDAATGLFSAYLDGTLDGTMTQDGTLDPSDHFHIGANRYGTSGPTRFFNGLIDDVAVYDIILSPDQVAALAGELRNPQTVLEVLQLTPTNLAPDFEKIVDRDVPGQLTWDDPADMIDPRYDVYLSTDPNMVDDVTTLGTNLDGSSVSIPASLESDTLYYWQVVATPLAGGTAYSSKVAVFKTSRETTGLIAYWPFDVDPNNVQGNTDFDGTLIGNAVISGDDVAEGAGALKIDHATGGVDHVNVPTNVLVGDQGYIRNTIVAWYKYGDIGNNGDSETKRNFVWETEGANAWVASFGLRGDVKEPQWYTKTTLDTGEGREMIGDPNTLDGQWHHVAVVMDDTSGDTNLKFYHDGTLIDDVTVPGELPLSDITGGFNIGANRAPAATGSNARNFDGYIDDMAVYDVALSDYQVSRLVCDPAVTPGNVLAVRKTYADFDDDGDVDIDDLSAFALTWLTADVDKDFDCSGHVDFVDFSELGGSWAP